MMIDGLSTDLREHGQYRLLPPIDSATINHQTCWISAASFVGRISAVELLVLATQTNFTVVRPRYQAVG